MTLIHHLLTSPEFFIGWLIGWVLGNLYTRWFFNREIKGYWSKL